MASIGSRIRWCAVVALLGLIVACGADQPASNPVPESGSGGGFGRAGQWTALPAAPLVARHEAVGAWVGDRFVVVGGRSTPMCPPNASCAAPKEPARRDGASFDPKTGTWTRIADAPVPVSGSRAVVKGGRLYLMTYEQHRLDSPVTFLSYDPQQDVWASHPLPPARGTLLAAGSVIVLVSGSDEQDPAVDAAFDPRTDTWRRLPDDPIGPSFDRSAVWVDGALLLSATDLVPNPGSERPALTRIARLDLDLSRWSILPDSQIIGYEPVAVAGLAVWPDLSSADGGGDWDRPYPAGGIFDPSTKTWRDLPAAPEEFTASCCSGVVVGDRVMIGNRLLDPVTGAWTPVPALPGGQRSADTVVGSPEAILVWAGATLDRPEGSPYSENLATGYLWRPAGAGGTATASPTATAPAKDRKCGQDGGSVVDRPDLVGRPVADVRREERKRDHQVRIVGADGRCRPLTADLRRDRVNLYSENGIVVWAQMF